MLVAVIAWAIGAALLANDAPGLVVLVPALVMLGAGVVGLGLLLWGLLRD